MIWRFKDEIEKLNEKVEQNACEFRCELEEIKLRLHTIVESLGQPPIGQPVEFARLPSKSVNVPTPPEQSHAQEEGFSAGPTTNPEPQTSQQNRVCILISPEQPLAQEEGGTPASPSTCTELQTSL